MSKNTTRITNVKLKNQDNAKQKSSAAKLQLTTKFLI